MLGRDLDARDMETCRGSIPPPWRSCCVHAGSERERNGATTGRKRAQKSTNDPGRARTCNPRLSGPMPYPLGHGPDDCMVHPMPYTCNPNSLPQHESKSCGPDVTCFGPIALQLAVRCQMHEAMQAEPDGFVVHRLNDSVTLSMSFLLLAFFIGGVPEGN